MRTRRGGRSSPLSYDPEIERTARLNRVNRRLFNQMESTSSQGTQQPPMPTPTLPPGFETSGFENIPQPQIPNQPPQIPIQPPIQQQPIPQGPMQQNPNMNVQQPNVPPPIQPQPPQNNFNNNLGGNAVNWG